MADQDQTLDQSLQGLQNMQGVQAVPGLPTMSPESLAALQKFIQQPALQKYVALVSNPQVIEDFTNVIKHPQAKQCLQFEGGWVVAMIVIRAWAMSKSRHWFKALAISFCTFVLFWVVAAIAIPSYFLNPAYMKLIQDVWRLLS
jgi:hypothetical protein